MTEQLLPIISYYQLGLIGFPLGHSLSPMIQQAALKACSLEGNYSLFPIEPSDRQGLSDLLDRMRTGELHGLNVTIPHKQTVIPLLDALTPTAQAIGAVSVIFMKDNRLIGDNMDAPGFLADLNEFAGKAINNKQPRLALVLGAGGSARAVVYALSHSGWQVTLHSRRMEQAHELIHSLGIKTVTVTESYLLEGPNFDLLVNTTPVGMAPHPDATPWRLPFPKQAIVYDLIYNPRETRLVREARAAGRRATTGLGMLVQQAVLGFETWTGRRPPIHILYDAVNQNNQ